MYFVGIDLAWSKKNGSGITVLKEENNKANFVSGIVLYSDDEIINYINKIVGKENCLVAIDAPLVVPNQKGRRIAEELVGKYFRKYNAGCHPSNRERFLQWSDTIRGETLVQRFERVGFEHNPIIKEKEQSRKIFEVFPHPSMVVLFSLDKVIPYKAKPKRNFEFRCEAFRKYQNHLKNLQDLNLPEEIAHKEIDKLNLKSLKDYEDLLDSIFCAYVAYYVWKTPQKCEIFGNMKEGYILTPVFDSMKIEISQEKKQRKLDYGLKFFK